MTEVEDFVFAKMESFLDFTLTVLFCEPCAFGPLINGRLFAQRWPLSQQWWYMVFWGKEAVFVPSILECNITTKDLGHDDCNVR